MLHNNLCGMYKKIRLIMARTKQSQKRSTMTTPVKPRKQLPPPPPAKQKRVWANCSVCGRNLRHWGRNDATVTNGHTCPPCTYDIIKADLEKRRASKKRIGLLVPQDERMPIRAIDTEMESSGIKGVTCMLYRYMRGFSDVDPIYTCRVGETMFLGDPDLKLNVRAMRIAGGDGRI